MVWWFKIMSAVSNEKLPFVVMRYYLRYYRTDELPPCGGVLTSWTRILPRGTPTSVA
jgi:hypothetical protein